MKEQFASRCPACGARFAVLARSAGKKFQCKECGTVFTAVAPTEAPAAEASGVETPPPQPRPQRRSVPVALPRGSDAAPTPRAKRKSGEVVRPPVEHAAAERRARRPSGALPRPLSPPAADPDPSASTLTPDHANAGRQQPSAVNDHLAASPSGERGVPAEPLPVMATPQRERLRRVWEGTIADAGVFDHGDPGLTYKPAARVARTRLAQPAPEQAFLIRPDASAASLEAVREAGRQGGYACMDKLGEGGMGVVWRAEQTSLLREVAVKEVKGTGAAPEQFVAEALVTGYLDHPNIVPVYALGQDSKGKLFLSMKRVQGLSWKRLLHPQTEDERARASKLDLEGHLKILLSVCNAVAYAHSKDVIHRDLKPENVMVGEFGEVLVMDWGIAVDVSEPAPQVLRTAHKSSITSPSGTPSYMAPEMAEGKGEQLGPWSDVFLLGAILHEVLMGRPPNQGNSVVESLISAVICPEPKLPESIPDELQEICLKAMSRSPSDRFQSVQDLQATLEGYLNHRESLLITEKADSEIKPLAKAAAKYASAYPSWLERESRREREAHYAGYAKAIARYEQALELWPDNMTARQSLTIARVAYARQAIANNDVGLAEAQVNQLERKDPDADRLRAQISSARKDIKQRALRERWLKRGLLSSVAVIFVAMSLAAIWINAERRAAVAAQAKEATQRKVAETQRAEAERRKIEAERERRIATQENYYNSISLAAVKIQEEQFDQARKLLDNTPEIFRRWEWGRLKYLCNLDRLTLKGHTDYITSVAYSPDGTRLATGGWDGTVKIWNAGTGKEVMTLNGHKGGITAVAFSPSGRNLASAGGQDWTAKLWDVALSREILTFKGHNESVRAVTFSPDGKVLATASWDNSAKLWNAETGDETRTLIGHSDKVNSVVFSPDGLKLATASWDGTAKLWEFSSGKEVLCLSDPGQLDCVAFSPDGQRIVTGGSNQGRIWSTESGQQLVEMRGLASLMSVSFSPDGKQVAATSWSRKAKIWDAHTGLELATLLGHSDAVESLSFAPDGRFVATGSRDRSVKIWDLKTIAKPSLVFSGHSSGVTSVAISKNGKYLATGSFDKTAKLWEVNSGCEILTLDGHSGWVWSVSFAPDSKCLATGSSDGTVILWDVKTGRQIKTLDCAKGGVKSVAFSPNGRLLASSCMEQEILVWEVESGRQILRIGGKTHAPAISFSPEGNQIATAGYRFAKIWDICSGKEIATFDEMADWVTSVAFSPNGRYVLIGGQDRAARLWNWKMNNQEIMRFSGHGDSVSSVAFFPDGERILTGSHDGLLRIFDVSSGRELLVLRGHDHWITSAAISANGRGVFSGSKDHTGILWSASDWKNEAQH